jgi:glutamate racemase
MNEFKIGFFDSGIGGLSVMKEVALLLPNESLVYLGDTARLPYGNKSIQTVQRYSLENAEFLKRQSIKLLVVACHTASSCAIDLLQDSLDIPVIGVTIAGIEALKEATSSKHVAVLATKRTIQSGIYQKYLNSLTLYPIACPLFVPLIEESFENHPATASVIEAYLNPIKDSKVDAVLLACTHYPLLAEQIQSYLGAKVKIIHPAKRVALRVKQILSDLKFQSSDQTPQYIFFSTDDPDQFKKNAPKFFPYPIKTVNLAVN